MCRFHWKIHRWHYWLIRCEFTKALQPNKTHVARADLWVHGENVGRQEFAADGMEEAVEGVMDLVRSYGNPNHGRVSQ